MGILISAALAPQLMRTNSLSGSGEMMLYVMLAAIGWAVTSYPATQVALLLRKLILKGKE